jgi:hypothetical protein
MDDTVKHELNFVLISKCVNYEAIQIELLADLGSISILLVLKWAITWKIKSHCCAGQRLTFLLFLKATK